MEQGKALLQENLVKQLGIYMPEVAAVQVQMVIMVVPVVPVVEVAVA